MGRPTFMTIDLAALRHNLQRVRELAPKSSVIAMVKANAYGHGIVRVAHALPTADALGVASLEEGLILRESGVNQPIVLMEGVFAPDELPIAVRNDFTLVVHHLPHLELLEKTKLNRPLTVWLKINTGMHRLGIAPQDAPDFYQRLSALPWVKQPVGLMTHFGCADEMGSLAVQEQLQQFEAAVSSYPGPKSLANSAGILAWKASHQDWVRPGLMLYGASPFPYTVGEEFNLAPVMSLWSRIIAITPVKKGGAVGYGATWVAPEDMLIGIVGVGYGDGYPQHAKNGTPVLVNQVECQLVGRVSMDMLAVDLRAEPNAKIGDPVILWGQGLPVERVAACSNTSAYEILTRMTPRPKVEVIT